MNFKILSLLSFILVINSCKQSPKESDNSNINHSAYELTEADVSKLKYTEFLLDKKTEETILSWNEYTQIKDIILNVKKGDLSFFKDNKNIISTLLKDFLRNIPEKMDTAPVKARITAFETKFYKLESFSNLTTTSKEELLNTIKELLISYSNLNLQMNKKTEADKNVFERP
ncbi:hypothetical protein [Aestuariibaculum sediminum]|uniref:Uncharacterized protein n=1 Tax=Aestuariibaculum sediminum TaxID=2770637 RepID=A0A8J6Q207_9FLAO|nr:hypothetical protein [Aestuariibaculum sediminum]MBD0831475.1 hypothetical protein [Aestuariibaculum sediminum]